MSIWGIVGAYHKASTTIIRSFDTVCLEDLNIKGMMQNGKLALSSLTAPFLKSAFE